MPNTLVVAADAALPAGDSPSLIIRPPTFHAPLPESAAASGEVAGLRDRVPVHPHDHVSAADEDRRVERVRRYRSGLSTTRTLGSRAARESRTSRVRSVDRPSATMTSTSASTGSASRGAMAWSSVEASLRAGITTEISGCVITDDLALSPTGSTMALIRESNEIGTTRDRMPGAGSPRSAPPTAVSELFAHPRALRPRVGASIGPRASATLRPGVIVGLKRPNSSHPCQRHRQDSWWLWDRPLARFLATTERNGWRPSASPATTGASGVVDRVQLVAGRDRGRTAAR